MTIILVLERSCLKIHHLMEIIVTGIVAEIIALF